MTPTDPTPDLDELERNWLASCEEHEDACEGIVYYENCARCTAQHWLNEHEVVFMPWLIARAREAEHLEAGCEFLRRSHVDVTPELARWLVADARRTP